MRPADPGDDEQALLLQERSEGLSGVLTAVSGPHLPDEQGLLLVSYDPVLEYAHSVGRVLHAIGDPDITRVVTAEIGVEIDAVRRAELGDLSGRAVQAVDLDRVDASPVQVEAADQILHADPLGSPPLWSTLDPAAACVAAAHWLAAAAEVAADLAGIAPPDVFGYADDLEAVSVEIPTLVVEVILGEQGSAREVVTGLLADAAAVREGRVPDPAALLDRVDAARADVGRVPAQQREQVLAGLLERVTPLDPLRPARDLLKHLLNGVRACLLVYREEGISHAGKDPRGEDDDEGTFDEDGFGQISARVTEEFTTAVRQRAASRHERLIR